MTTKTVPVKFPKSQSFESYKSLQSGNYHSPVILLGKNVLATEMLIFNQLLIENYFLYSTLKNQMFLSVVFSLRKIWSHKDEKQYNSKDLTGAVHLRWSPRLWFICILILTIGQNRKASCSSTLLGINRK